jgi:hypothetical protein
VGALDIFAQKTMQTPAVKTTSIFSGTLSHLATTSVKVALVLTLSSVAKAM